jgi:ATP-dependent DNA helicase MPH1
LIFLDYRWFPTGKVVFVAPTKPLVAQQVDACHAVCGIPGRDAKELTGDTPRAVRARLVSFLIWSQVLSLISKQWEEKRVFYMTPQTLVNDLRANTCDPRDIVLIVIGIHI